MKLRAPRCNAPLFAMSTSACQAFQFVWVAPSAPSPASAANTPPDASSNAPHINASSARTLMRMVGHPLRHGFRRAHSRIDRHQYEEGEVQNAEYPGEHHVRAFGRLQSQIAERNERDGEDRQGHLRDKGLVADRLHR